MLSKSLDDILDYYKATVNEMEIYEIKPSTELMEMVLILEEGTENICDSVYSMKMDKETSMKDAVKAKNVKTGWKIYTEHLLPNFCKVKI